MTDDIYQDMVQPRGPAYRSSQIQPWSHYREPIDTSDGRLQGESRRWGDASAQTQSRVIDALIESSREAGLNARETAYVLAIARVESGFNPDAAAGTTSASGLGQFIDRTGRAYDINASNRFDVAAQSDALVRHFIDNRDLARSRGQGEEYIYKYHHDGPSRDYGGLGLSNREIVPHLDAYERFVAERLTQTQGRTQQPAAPGQGTTAREDAPTNAAPAAAAAGFAGVMQTMLPPQNGVAPHITSDFGPRSVAGGSSDHRGVDFNYRGGQAGMNLQHPTVRSPVSGEVVFSGGQYGTVKIRDGEGNMHEILHLNSRSVQLTDPPTRINAGDPIGTMGGRGPNGAGQYAQHVHYQVRDPSGQTVDPERFWNGRQVQAPTGTGAEARTQAGAATGGGALRLNERGPDVIALQESLNRLGYTGRDGQPLETRSGIYGEDTKHAVQALQRAHGIGVDGVVGRDTRGALAAAIASPLMSEASHPNHQLFAEIARQLPPGTRPEVAANITMQAMENGITSPDRLAGVMVRDSDVFVAGNMPGERAKVDLNAPTPKMQEMSDHTRQQSAQQEQARTQQAPVQTSDTEQLRPRTMLA